MSCMATSFSRGRKCVHAAYPLANVSLMTLDRFYKENMGMVNPERFFTRADKQKAIGLKDKTFEADCLFRDDDWS